MTVEGLDAVSVVRVVAGEYAGIAPFELADPDDHHGVVAEDIHGIVAVVDTVTNVAFEP